MNYWVLLALQLLPILVVLWYLNIKRKYTYWEKLGVRGPPPTFYMGNGTESMRRGMVDVDTEWHAKYGPIFGTYSGRTPILVISDPELIKNVMIKDFGSFMNRTPADSRGKIDKQNLFNLQDDDWKRVRAIASPSFTSGKLRGMNPLMNQCVDKLVAYFDKITTKEGSGVAEINTKEVLTGFTIDVIASTSFATETNSNDDRSKSNVFLEQAKLRFRFPKTQILAMTMLPRWLRKLTYPIIPPLEIEKEITFFHELAKQIMIQRRDNPKIKRNDFVQLLMDARVSDGEISNANFDKLTATDDKDDEPSKDNPSPNSPPSTKSTTKSLSDIEIIASSVLFFVAGFETTASTLTHCLFELARNPDIQERLHDEIRQAVEDIDDQNSAQYNETVLSQIPYLEATMKETLRKYPPLARLERRVGVDGYKLGGVPLIKGQTVQVSAYVVQHNPDYYSDPERFNPDRFLPENKHLLTPYTYMPFGQGPRNCIGMRFAYQEIKLVLAKIVQQFRFEPTVDTPSKLELGKIALSVAKTFPLKVSRR